MSINDEGTELRIEVTSWWALGLILFVFTAVVVAVMGYVGVFTSTVVEREVFESSHQYSEARKSEIATYEAQLAEIDVKLANPKIGEATRNGLQAQKSAINIRLRAARAKSK